MTTWTAAEDQALADALGDVAAHLERHGDRAAKSVHEMRSAAQPGNGFRVAALPFAARPSISAALRAVAADGPHPLAERLEGIAVGFDQEAAVRAANGQR